MVICRSNFFLRFGLLLKNVEHFVGHALDNVGRFVNLETAAVIVVVVVGAGFCRKSLVGRIFNARKKTFFLEKFF